MNIFILYLNDMRSPKIEIVEPVAASHDRAALVTWLEGELRRNEAGEIEGWTDDSGAETGHHGTTKWGKAFKQGSPLEWYNKLYDGADPDAPYAAAYMGDAGIVEIIPLDAAVQREMERVEAELRAQYDGLTRLPQPCGPITI